jgi:hypothetical protein
MSAGIIERAFQLARSGDYSSMEDLKRRLAREGYEAVSAHLSGRLTRDQLTGMMAEAARRSAAAERVPASPPATRLGT